MKLGPPTPYIDVNALLDALVCGVRGTLGDGLIGIYLYGSLALGGFDPGAGSDIDFLVATEGELAGAQLAELERLHARLAAGHPRWGRELEGSYIPRQDLRRYDPARAVHPHVFEGRFWAEQHGVHWVIERHVLREHGLVLHGPEPGALIDPVSPAELRHAVKELLRTWWLPMALDPVRLHDAKYRAYAVVTMCRILYTLDTGEVIPKPAAAAWARAALDQPWRGLVERAASEADDLLQVREFIRYTVTQGSQSR